VGAAVRASKVSTPGCGCARKEHTMRPASRVAATCTATLWGRPLWASSCSRLPRLQYRAASGAPAPGAGTGVSPEVKQRGAPPTLVNAGGLPISSTAGKENSGAGPEITLTPQNASQVLQSQGVLLMQVGTLGDAVNKKITRLRVAAGGRMPLVHLDCQSLPQICQALQIRSSPCMLLMARGQVAAAFENDVSAPAATGFVEQVAKMLGLKVDLAEDVGEQLAGFEELEWSDPATAEASFEQVGQAADLPIDMRIRAAAGRVRCAIRQPGRLSEAKALVKEMESAGHGAVAEVKQAVAMLRLADRSADAPPQFEKLKAACEADPKDFAAAEAYATALFWSCREGEAVDVGLRLLRRSPRSDQSRNLVLDLIEALGPRHPRNAKARKSFNNALFI